jgi:hypothetical protein
MNLKLTLTFILTLNLNNSVLGMIVDIIDLMRNKQGSELVIL